MKLHKENERTENVEREVENETDQKQFLVKNPTMQIKRSRQSKTHQ